LSCPLHDWSSEKGNMLYAFLYLGYFPSCSLFSFFWNMMGEEVTQKKRVKKYFYLRIKIIKEEKEKRKQKYSFFVIFVV
jgi:hypothetical protein